jgi:hypothetical protein
MNENPVTEKETPEEWTMPEPVFRSSEGISPKENAAAEEAEMDAEDEVPTDIMDFVDEDETSSEAYKQSVRVKEKSPRRHRKKKHTQSKLMRGLALVIGLLIGSVILAVIYFLFR